MVWLSSKDTVLVVDKPPHKTSHDIVAQARRLAGTRAVGHAGTLDPFATGVLLLLFGQACKLNNYLTAQSKRYLARIQFGSSTDTLDCDGTITETTPVDPSLLSPERVEHALEHERTRAQQMPPQYSAIKVAGRPAYALARQGETVELEPRAVQVEELRLHELGSDYADVELCVSKGYYVRSLARDLGATLGIPAHLTSLRRTSSGAFALSEAAVWPPAAEADLRFIDLVSAANRCLPHAVLNDVGALRARQGKALSSADFEGAAPPAAASAWLGPERQLVAIGHAVEADSFKVLRGFS